MALAFGVASGAGAEAGLYGAVCVGLFAAIFGGTRTLISEPTGPMTVVMTAVVASLVAANPERGLESAFAVVLVAGLTQLVFGLLRLGRYVTLMPYSVISGFMSGIGILLILIQIAPLVGVSSPSGGAISVVKSLPKIVEGARWQECVIALVGLIILFRMPSRWKRYCPPHLVALVVGTGAALLFFSGDDLRRIGEIPMGLPDLRIPFFAPEHLRTILVEGIILGILGCVDTLLTAMIADSLTRDQHDSDRELRGQGVGNIVSSLFGGLPGAGATMGTVVNIKVGARSPIAAILRAAILLSIILFLGPYLSVVPMAILAAIAVKVGFDILDWSFLKRAHQVSRSASVIMYTVMALTVFVDLIFAVGFGVFVANVLTIDRLSRIQSEKGIRTIDPTDADIPMTPEERALFEEGKGGIILLHLSGPMIFGVAKALAREHEALGRARALIVDLLDVPLLSTTVALAIENVVRDAREAGVDVYVCTAPGDTRTRLEQIERSGKERLRFCESRKQALEAAVEGREPISESFNDGKAENTRSPEIVGDEASEGDDWK